MESRHPHHGAVQAFIKCSQCRTCNLGFASQIKTIVVGAVQEYKCSYSDFTARQTSQAHLRTFKTGCAIHMFALWKRSKVHERFSVRVSDLASSTKILLITGPERAIKSDYSSQTAIEDQSVTRLASLLWRLRRAVTIESGLLSIRAGIIRDQSAARPTIELNTDRLSIFRQFLRPGVESQRHEQRETN